MLKGYRIVDADSHVIEPHDMWEKYLEPAFKSFAPSPDFKIKGEKILDKISDQVFAEGIKQVAQAHPMSLLNGFDPESQVRAMGQMGVDVSFLYPSHALWILAIDTMEPQLVGGFTRAYNNWLRDFCSYNPDILKGVGAINLHAPEEMVSELQRIVEFQ